GQLRIEQELRQREILADRNVPHVVDLFVHRAGDRVGELPGEGAGLDLDRRGLTAGLCDRSVDFGGTRLAPAGEETGEAHLVLLIYLAAGTTYVPSSNTVRCFPSPTNFTFFIVTG